MESYYQVLIFFNGGTAKDSLFYQGMFVSPFYHSLFLSHSLSLSLLMSFFFSSSAF